MKKKPTPNHSFFLERYEKIISKYKIQLVASVFFMVLLNVLSALSHGFLQNIMEFPKEGVIIFLQWVNVVVATALLLWIAGGLALDREKEIEKVLSEKIIPIITETSPHASIIENEVDSKYLNSTHRALKDLVHYEVLNRHISRISSIRENAWIRIYSFSFISKLIEFLFQTRGGREDYLYDYTVAYNADYIFRNYSFSDYFKDLFKIKQSAAGCETRINILINCELDPIQESFLNADDVDIKMNAPASAALHFEDSLMQIFKIYIDKHSLDPDLPLIKIYEKMRSDTEGQYSLRIITKNTTKKAPASINASFEQPFNVYGDVCVSRSVIRNLNTSDERPVPHLAVCVHTGIRRHYQDLFEFLWNEELAETSKFQPDDVMADFTTGKFVRRWISHTDTSI